MRQARSHVTAAPRLSGFRLMLVGAVLLAIVAGGVAIDLSASVSASGLPAAAGPPSLTLTKAQIASVATAIEEKSSSSQVPTLEVWASSSTQSNYVAVFPGDATTGTPETLASMWRAGVTSQANGSLTVAIEPPETTTVPGGTSVPRTNWYYAVGADAVLTSLGSGPSATMVQDTFTQAGAGSGTAQPAAVNPYCVVSVEAPFVTSPFGINVIFGGDSGVCDYPGTYLDKLWLQEYAVGQIALVDPSGSLNSGPFGWYWITTTSEVCSHNNTNAWYTGNENLVVLTTPAGPGVGTGSGQSVVVYLPCIT